MVENNIENLKGTVESIIFRNEENGYTVIEIDNGEDLITVVGNMGEVREGDQISFMGSYTSHRSFGLQFQADSWEISRPEGSQAIEKYLSSGAIKGIGPILAKRIVGEFGDKTLDILENKPNLLSRVKGISPKKAADIEEEFKRVFGMRTVMIFLAGFDIPSSAGIRAWKKFGSLTNDLIKENPFVLCIDSIGVSFKNADKIRVSLDMDSDVPCRLSAGILYILQNQQWEGHACLPIDLLISMTSKLLGIPEDSMGNIVYQLEERESIITEIIDGTEYIYLPSCHKAETYIASRIGVTLRSVPNLEKSFAKEINALEQEGGIQYADLQKKAINLALTSPITILTGGPGTGKTTTLNAIISIFKSQGKNVSIVAPTGRAAQRISELTGYDAKTIHRLLGVEYGEDHTQTFVHDEKKLLPCDVLIVDELSMVDVLVFEGLLRASKMSCQIVLVGDTDQLPPVGIGNVLKDLVDSKCVPIVKLKEIFRQAAESLIVTNAHLIINGKMPDISRRDKECDFFLVKSNTQSSVSDSVLGLYKERLPKAYGFSPANNIQILCPTRIGSIGTTELNRLIQSEINPFCGENKEIKYGNKIFRVGDKVMQTKNNYDIVWKRNNDESDEKIGTGIFNGDIGRIVYIDKMAGVMQISFDDRTADYMFEQLGEIDHAYAITVHKSQGSEFDAVIFPLSERGGRLYYRNLLYTAVTRAKKLMIIVGSLRAVEQMILNTYTTLKYTNLCYFLQKETEMIEF